MPAEVPGTSTTFGTVPSGELSRQVRHALARLYDPVSLRTHPLAKGDGQALRQRLLVDRS